MKQELAVYNLTEQDFGVLKRLNFIENLGQMIFLPNGKKKGLLTI